MTSIQIPLAKPAFDEREVEAVRRVLESGWVIQGPQVAGFEEDVAALHQVEHAIAVSSGTAALHVAYLALELGKPDAIFVPSFAWPSAANMALAIGAVPILVDVDPSTYNLSPDSLQAALDLVRLHKMGVPRAVVVVHQFGLAASLEPICAIARTAGMIVIEDAACALGATRRGIPVGADGEVTVLSFHPRKAVTTGEGGMILTNDAEIAERCRSLRNHGQTMGSKRDIEMVGFNYRMSDIAAAIGRCQLQKLATILSRRRLLAKLYSEELSNCELIALPHMSEEHTWQTYMVVLDKGIDREAIVHALHAVGIESGPGSLSAHCMTLHSGSRRLWASGMPASERLNQQGLALPLHGGLSEEDVLFVASKLRKLVE